MSYTITDSDYILFSSPTIENFSLGVYGDGRIVATNQTDAFIAKADNEVVTKKLLDDSISNVTVDSEFIEGFIGDGQLELTNGLEWVIGTGFKANSKTAHRMGIDYNQVASRTVLDARAPNDYSMDGAIAAEDMYIRAKNQVTLHGGETRTSGFEVRLDVDADQGIIAQGRNIGDSAWHNYIATEDAHILTKRYADLRLVSNKVVAGNSPSNSTGASATGEGAVAISVDSKSSGLYSVAIGYDTLADSDYTVTIGYRAGHAARDYTPGFRAVSIGYEAAATKHSATSIGPGAFVFADNGVAIGRFPKVEAGATNSVAIGRSATVSHEKSVAIGGNVKTSQTGQVSFAGGDITHVKFPSVADDTEMYNLEMTEDDTGAVVYNRFRGTLCHWNGPQARWRADQASVINPPTE